VSLLVLQVRREQARDTVAQPGRQRTAVHFPERNQVCGLPLGFN
jgi:hypothetical protein